ncbi:diguanylate cyclase domain-containing protein, partial [Stenotrophomonas sp. 3diitr2024]|uniref:diguanylate cyclase domain-containing protein n=1 Tax=Stenotrophomonas sp. 3diitr2024 TaxID=3345115 RepID=UPI0035CA7567
QVQPTANTTVEVSCPDAGGWRLFVPVKVRRNQTVLVLNRRFLPTVLRREIELATRNRTPFSLLLLDLDHFKAFYEKEPGQVPETYTMSHIAGGYVFDRKGRLRLFAP